MDLDVTGLVIQGVFFIPLLFGLVEFIKTMLDWEGKKVTALSMAMGVLLGVLYQAYPLIPEPWSTWVGFVLFGIGAGLAASGFHKFATRND